jgi:hypothetical protein
MAISAPRFDFIERLRHAQATDPALVAVHAEVRAGTHSAPWALVDDMVAFDGCLYIPSASLLLQEILAAVHNNGHEGIHRTLHRLRRDFHFPNMRRLVQDFMKACVTCQQYKTDHLRPAGLLQPLPVPSAVWADIGIDFIEALPKVQGKTVILSIVDRFSKYCHFIPLAHPYTAKAIAHAFFANIVPLHGVPQSIVSDRDPVFTSAFWQELMQLTGTKLYMSFAFHPQTDGQIEAANRVIVMYLRAVSPATAPGSGSIGCHGRNTLTTQPISHRSATLRFVWSMAGIPRPSAPMSPERPASQQSPRRWRSALPSSTTSAIDLNRHRQSRSASTTSTTGRCPSRLAIGLFFAFGSGQQHPFHARQQGSSSPDTSGRTRWRSSSTRWLCGYGFRPALAFMMCSMLASSRSLSVPRRPFHRCCLCSCTVLWCLRLPG